MATPFKRVCLRASKQIKPSQQQWRALTTSTPLRQEQAAPPQEPPPPPQQDALSPTDPSLTQLLSQPGVQYTTHTQPDPDLGKYAPAGLSSLAHRELEQHRELRELVRLAAWEMPRLAALAKPFERPAKDQVLRWRYTTYMGESHPAGRKVVVTFKPKDIPGLDRKQRLKLLKLAGVRYNPGKKEIKLSSESFETPAQNKRYLADTVNALIAEAKNAEGDQFEDVPLDLRHGKRKVKHEFPKGWRMTPERRMQLEGAKRAAEQEVAKKIEQGGLVEGMKAIAEARGREVEVEEAPVMVEARRGLGPGRLNRRGP